MRAVADAAHSHNCANGSSRDDEANEGAHQSDGVPFTNSTSFMRSSAAARLEVAGRAAERPAHLCFYRLGPLGRCSSGPSLINFVRSRCALSLAAIESGNRCERVRDCDRFGARARPRRVTCPCVLCSRAGRTLVVAVRCSPRPLDSLASNCALAVGSRSLFRREISRADLARRRPICPMSQLCTRKS